MGRCVVFAFLFFSTTVGWTEEAKIPADAWPQFRRDALRSGDNPDAALKFPLQRETAIRMLAAIYASPAVVAGRVYIQDARGNVACIEAADNRVLWLTSLGGINNTSSPAVANGKVYVGSSTGALFILHAELGTILHKVPAEGGVLTAPALANGAVYFNTFAGKLVKIDDAGNIQWTFTGGKLSVTDIAVRDKQILFFAGTNNTRLYRLLDEGKEVKVLRKIDAPSNCCPVGGPAFVTADLFAFQSFDSEMGRFYLMKEDGKTLLANDISDSRAVPAFRGDRIYRGDKTFQVAGLKQLSRTDPQYLYDGGFHSSPALGKNALVVGCEQGMVHCFDLESKGKVQQPIWQYQTSRAGKPNGAVSSSPAVVKGKIYFGGEDGILYGLGSGKEVAVVDAKVRKVVEAPVVLKGSQWPTPGGDMGYSYVSTDREVKPPFAVEWKTKIWSVFKAPMIVAEGRVYCAGRLGNLTALDAATGAILWKTHHPGVESRPAPTVAEGRLYILRSRNNQGDSPYVSGASGGPAGEGLYCHDPVTGEVVWHQPMKFRYHFNHDGLAIHEGKVFVTQGAKDAVDAVAFDAKTGKEVWRKPLPDLAPAPEGKGVFKLPPRFSGVIASGLWVVSISDRGTLAINPSDGKVVWSKQEPRITFRARIAARDGIVVVFAADGDYALDAKTGESLWKGAATSSRYTQALTDRYLKSEGKEGFYPPAVCAWPVYANGYWYSHYSFTAAHGSNQLACMKEPEGKDFGVLTPKMVVWTHDFLSNACPAPSPAYGRLYYSPASEGVIYSFVPKAE